MTKHILQSQHSPRPQPSVYPHPQYILGKPEFGFLLIVLAVLMSVVNKASGGDEIPVKLFQILKDYAVKVLHSICQQIWKT